MRHERKLILIADADTERAEHIKMLVRRCNSSIEVRITTDLWEANAWIQRFTVVLFFVSLEFGKQGYLGMELIRHLRKKSDCYFLPIAVISDTDRFREEVYVSLHCVRYFCMPLKDEEVMELVLHIVSRVDMRDADKEFLVRKDGVRYVIRVRDIVYAKNCEGGLYLCLNHQPDMVLPQKSIDYIMAAAKSKWLLRCSRDELVNRMHIYNMSPESGRVILGNDMEVKIEKDYIREIQEECSIERE